MNGEQPVMLADEAFKILGLPTDADESEIRRTYYKRSTDIFRGGVTEDHDLRPKLNAAYQVALEALHPEAMIIRAARSLRRFERAVAAEHAGRIASEAVRRMEQRRIRPLQHRRALAWAGAAIAILTALLLQALDIFGEVPLAIGSTVLGFICAFGLVGLWFELMVIRLRHSFESFTEDLASSQACARALARALDYKNVKVIAGCEVTWEDGLDRSRSVLKSLFPGLSRSERNLLLVLKAIEQGLLLPSNLEHTTDERGAEYEVTFNPRDFDTFSD